MINLITSAEALSTVDHDSDASTPAIPTPIFQETVQLPLSRRISFVVTVFYARRVM